MGQVSSGIGLAAYGLLVVLSLGGCRRAEPLDGTPLYPPFNHHKPIAVVHGGVDQGRYEIAVRSRMQGRLALQLRIVGLRGESGKRWPVGPNQISCVLGGGSRVRILSGTAGELPASDDYDVEVEGEVIPLDQPGRSMYREWAWLRRPNEVEAIDAELAALDGLAPCGSIGSGAAQ